MPETELGDDPWASLVVLIAAAGSIGIDLRLDGGTDHCHWNIDHWTGGDGIACKIGLSDLAVEWIVEWTCN